MRGAALLLALAACPAKPIAHPPPPPEGDRRCTADSDCTASDSCRLCGQCFSVQPALIVDCEAVCSRRPQCRCVNGLCTEPGDGRCTRDTDCSASTSCTYCGRCFSTQPALATDCQAQCDRRPACVCDMGRCVARTAP